MLQALAFVPLRFLFPQYTIICDVAYKLPIFRARLPPPPLPHLMPAQFLDPCSPFGWAANMIMRTLCCCK